MGIIAQRTWKPKVAGILDVVAGSLSALGAFLFFLGGCLTLVSGEDVSVHFISVLVLAVGAGLAVLGGIYALSRKKWIMALAGSIAILCPTGWAIYMCIESDVHPLYLGIAALEFCLCIAAVTLTLLSKKEFA